MASDAVEGSRRRIQDNVLVAVRVRPCSDDAIVSVTGNDLSLATPRSNLGGGGGGARSHSFAFDRCYLDATQADIFADLGESVLRNAFDGFNSTVLAYGQTGSGKSYCMMGTPDSPGLIPNIASALFDRIDQVGGDDRRRTFHCEASYLEIYNERVRDLLAPARAEGAGLTVREHPVHGPYVEDLSVIPVQSFDDVQRLITQGNSARTVAATRMNAESSRSHAIFTMTLKQALSDRTSGATSEKVARMHLVDLAGSERQVKTKAKGAHLKEASEINKSLVTLGRVISALADASSAPRRPSASSPRAAHPHIPFRDSTLTWLLKGSFGLSGNARTALLCTISARPSDYEETLGALRYAARAKKIVTTAVCNEDSDVKVVECLKQEIADLTERLNHAERWSAQEIATLTTELEQSQKLIDTVNMSWGEKLAKAESIRQRREQALISEGIAVKMDPALPFLCNLAEDPAVSECLVYYLRQGETRVGRSRDLAAPCIVLHDEHVPDLLCVFTNINGAVQVKPWDGARGVHVNGQTVERAVALAHGDRVILGRRLSFRFSASIQSIERKSMQRSQAKIDYEFAQAELNARLSSVIEDLERERQQVRLLQERVQSTGAEYSTAVAQLETERLAKLELSRQLQFAREQNSVHERSLESTKSLSASQQRELRAVHQELQLEKAMRMDLSRTIDAMSQSVQSPTTTCAAARADVDEWVGRVLRRAIMRRRRESSTTLGELLASVDQANAMAHALSHEVLFDVGCTWQAVGITVVPIVRMRHRSRTFSLSKSQFNLLFLHLRELYCEVLERGTARQRSSTRALVDPIDRLMSQAHGAVRIGAGEIHTLRNVWNGPWSGRAAVLDSGAAPIAHLQYTLTSEVRGPTVGRPWTLTIRVDGVRLLDENRRASMPVDVSFAMPVGPDLMAYHVPTVAGHQAVPVDWVLPNVNESDLDVIWHCPTIRFTVMGAGDDGDDVGADILQTVADRHSSLKRVSVLKTPSIGPDGSICVPGPSPRLRSARIGNGATHDEASAWSCTTSRDAKCSSVVMQPLPLDSSPTRETRLHVTVEIQELSTSTGTYSPCSMKATKDSADVVYRVGLHRAKRFNVRIVQADTATFTLESCHKLNVVAIRSGTLRDPTLFECDIVQEHVHMHDRVLSFRCAWPADLVHHSYTQRGTTFDLDLELNLFVQWQSAPVAIRRTVTCKAYAGMGLLRSLVNNIARGGHRPAGVFCTVASGPITPLVASMRAQMSSLAKSIAVKLDLEKVRQRSSRSYTLADVVLEALSRYRCVRDATPGTPATTPTSKGTITQTSDINSQTERNGYLVDVTRRRRRMYYVLRYPLLQVYGDASSQRETDAIDLVSAAVHIDAANAFTLVLQTKASGAYTLQASSEDDLHNWVQCLARYILVVR